MDQEKIGVFISTLRKEQGMTQQQLAYFNNLIYTLSAT
jgi:transcriptional regulator with XRE-family HTH domain